ncbi:MAG: RsmB/NOP family class I SAM-dependent RNA methyltransferase, partial [Saprospiraceae bacterium]
MSPKTDKPNPIPIAFQQQMIDTWGLEAWKKLEMALQTQSPTSIRLHPQKSKYFKTEGLPIPWCPWGKYLEKRPVFTLDPVFHAGGYYVQEAASMFLWYILEQLFPHNRDINVLDLCAAPGGKSTLIASFLQNNGMLVTNEVIKNRAYILKSNIEKTGYKNVIVTQSDPKDFEKLEGFFDLILVDAPCSGEGMWRKDSQAINEWSEDHVQLCSSRQKRIVSDITPCLKEDGYLIYSTCTYNDAENLDNVAWANQNMSLQNITLPPTKDFHLVEVEKNGVVGYQFSPHTHDSEGLFYAILQKKEKPAKANIKLKNQFEKLPAKWTNVLRPYVQIDEHDLYFLDPNNDIHLFPSRLWESLNVLYNSTRIIYAGINLGQWVKN